MTMADSFLRTQAARSVLSRGVPAVSLNLGAATAAVSAPMLDVRAAGAAGQGMAAIAQGIGAAGDVLGRLASQQAKQINERHILEAESAMDEVRGKIAARWINEPDETKWQGIASEEMTAAEGGILHESLSPDAREAVSARMVRWRARTLGEAMVSSARRSREKLTEELGARAMRFEAAGDAAGAQAIYGHMEKEGLIAADRAEALRQKATEAAESKQREARANELVTIARTQGREAAAEYIESSAADPVEKERLRSEADSIHRDEVGMAGDEFEEAVYSGALKVPGEVDAWKKDDPRITSKMREQFKAFIARKNDATAKANIEARAPELSSKLLSDVKQIDPNTATDEQFNLLRMQIAELPEGYREIPYARLMAKFRKSDDPAPGTLDVVENELHSYLEQGLFSGADDPQLIPDIPTFVKTPEADKLREKQNKKIQARIDANAKNRKAKIGGEVRRWLDANPDATPDQVLKYMREKLPESTRAAMFDAFDVAPSTVEGNGAQNDLPTRGGPVENTLLPPLIQ